MAAMDEVTARVLAETWEVGESAAGHGEIVCTPDRLTWIHGADNDPDLDNDVDARHALPVRDAFILVAPEALRLLLAGEWADNSDGEYYPRCPWCSNRDSTPLDNYSMPGKHSMTCPLVAILVKAGLR